MPADRERPDVPLPAWISPAPFDPGGGSEGGLSPAPTMMQGKRLERVNQLIKEEVSAVLQRQLKDPRLGFVTVTEVDTTADLKLARVYVSVLGPEDQWAKSFQALESARGFVWNWLRKHLDLRVTPEIAFRPDRSMEHAAHIQSLLAGLKSRDAEDDA